MTQFVWESEEDDWEATVDQEPPDQPPRRRWPWWVLLIMFVIAGALFWVFRQTDQAEMAFEQEVVELHELATQAIDGNDIELLDSMLSGRNLLWVDAQRELLVSGDRFARSAFGLERQATENAAWQTSVVMSTDLRSATITTTVPYVDRFGQTIELNQVAIYRAGTDRWLMSPPLSESWGNERSITVGPFTATYYDKDAEIIKRLLADLHQLYRDACLLSAAPCDPADSIELVFDQALMSLVPPVEQLSFYAFPERQMLPTPTLVGLPADDDAYQALLYGYAYQIFPAIWSRAAGYLCCDERLPLIQTLTEAHMREIDWLPPLADAERNGLYESFLRSPFLLDEDQFRAPLGSEIANEQRMVAWQANLLAVYLQERYGRSPMELYREVAGSRSRWIISLFPAPANADLEHREMVDFAFEQVGSVEIMSSPPEQLLEATCKMDNGPIAAWQFDFQLNDWRQLERNREAVLRVVRVMDDDRTRVWFENAVLSNERFAFTTFDQYTIESTDIIIPLENYFGDRDNRALILSPFQSAPGRLDFLMANAVDEQFVYGSIDVEACLLGNCGGTDFAGIPVWSPDQQHILQSPPLDMATDELQLLGHPGHFIREVGRVSSMAVLPVSWIDSQQFVFGSVESDGFITDDQLVLGNVSNTELVELLSVNDMIDQIPNLDQSFPWRLLTVEALPNQPDKLMLSLVSTTGGGFREQGLIVFYDIPTSSVTQHIDVSNLDPFGGDFSSGGRWYIWHGFGSRNSFVIDVQKQQLYQTRAISNSTDPLIFNGGRLFDVSADERWLVRFGESYMTLTALESDRSVLRQYPEGAVYCVGGGWVYR